MRARLILLSTLMAAGCTGWLIDYSGTKCDVDSDCGGGLVCVAGKCAKGSSPGQDASILVALDAALPVTDGALPVGDGSVEGLDASTPGADAGEWDGALPAGLDAAEPGLDATILAGLDAAHSGLDAAYQGPTSECTGTGWCRPTLPAFPPQDGGLPDLMSVSGSSEKDIWVVGKAQTMLHWNGKQWQDYSPLLRGLNAPPATYGVDDLFLISARAPVDYITYGGRKNNPLQDAVGWLDVPYDVLTDEFYDGEYGGGDPGYGWIGEGEGAASSGTWHTIMLGEQGHMQDCYSECYPHYQLYDGGTPPPQPDLHGAGWSNPWEVWLVGAAGHVYLYTMDAPNQFVLDVPGSPQETADLYAVWASNDGPGATPIDGSLLLLGDQVQWNCTVTHTGMLNDVSLTGCTRTAHQYKTVRAMQGTGPSDLMAVGADTSSPGLTKALLVKVSPTTWSEVPMTGINVNLNGLFRYGNLVVIVGDNGTLLSALNP